MRRTREGSGSIEEGISMDTSPPASSNRKYLIFVAGVLLLGFMDGAHRAITGQPTLLGEDVGEPRLEQLEELHTAMGNGYEFSIPETPTMLRGYQKNVGEHCRHQYNCMSEFVCRNQTCVVCKSSAECHERNVMRQCFNTTEDPFPVCRHKALFFPLTEQDMIMFVITFFTIAFSAPTGTGGGGILVPMFMIIGQFSPHAAVPLSKATILGGAIANNILNVQRRHPFANRPLIDYGTLHVMVPNLLAGTIFGVFVNAVSPAWLITFGLVLSLGYSTYSAGNKAWKLYVEESRMENEDAGSIEPLVLKGNKMKARHYSFDDPSSMSPELADIVKLEGRHNFRALGLVTIVWLIVALCSWVKGGSGTKSLVGCGSWQFYLVAFAPVPVVLFITWTAGKALNELHEQKKACGYRFADGDVMWTPVNTRFYPLLAVSLGVLAGSLGLAAGTLLGPVLLQLNLHPLVSMATTGFMVLFTASSTSLQYLLLGRLKLDYALCYTSIGFVAACVGNTFINFLVKRYRKTWILVFVLFVTIGFSTLLLGYVGTFRTFRAWIEGQHMGFVDICQDRAHMLLPAPPLSEPIATRNMEFPLHVT